MMNLERFWRNPSLHSSYKCHQVLESQRTLTPRFATLYSPFLFKLRLKRG